MTALTFEDRPDVFRETAPVAKAARSVFVSPSSELQFPHLPQSVTVSS